MRKYARHDRTLTSLLKGPAARHGVLRDGAYKLDYISAFNNTYHAPLEMSYKTASVCLSCPLYAAAFDPHDNRRLLVGGGGGEGRSGVENKIVSVDLLCTEGS